MSHDPRLEFETNYHAISESVFFGFARRVWTDEGRWRIKIRWKRTLITFFTLLIMGYMSAVTALFFYLREAKDYRELSFIKLTFIPFTYESFEQDMGNYQVKRGLQAFEDKEYSLAFGLLRSGVRRAPDNLEGRMTLAKFYLPRRYRTAIDILDYSLMDQANNLEYVTLYFSILLQYNMDDVAIEKSEAILSKTQDPEVKALVAYYTAVAYAYRGRYDAAEDLIREYDLMEKIDGYILQANLDWERGNEQVAIERLENGLRKFPGAVLPFYQSLTAYHIKRGEYDAARRYCILRNTYNPEAFGPRIDLLYVYSYDGDEERKQVAIESIFEDFKHEAEAMKMLIRFASIDGNAPLAERLLKLAQSAEWDTEDFVLEALKTHINTQNYQQAIDLGERTHKTQPEWLEEGGELLNATLSAAYYGIGNKNLSDVYLGEFLKNREQPADQLIKASQIFASVDALTHSHKVLRMAYDLNPNNQQILSELLSTELALGMSTHMKEYLDKLLDMRRPSRNLLEKAYKELASDRFIFATNRAEMMVELRSLLGTDSI